ncbi:MAG: 3-deoxy-D-manno-octulosonic acid transferase [Xanthobacteraceae bacterium]
MNGRLPTSLAAYRLLTRAATPLAQQLLAYRLSHGKEHPVRILERRGESKVARPNGPLIWIHGASVGEMMAALPLIERITARGFAVLVTSGTVTSANLARQRLPHGAIHQFIPLDTPGFVERFLNHWKPSLALFVESDLWPNLIIASKRRGIPLILINGRLSDRSFKRWRRMPRTIEALLQRFDLCLMRSTSDAEHFSELGAPRLSVVGNLKLDVPQLPVEENKLIALSAAFLGRPTLAAASTHPGEEEVILEVHANLKVRLPSLVTIIAPRHPDRGAEIAALAAGRGFNAVLRSSGKIPDKSTEIYICDTVGELGIIYRIAPVVFMGGSLVPHGGQNPIEAIKLGAAIIHGPFIGNFAEIYAALDGARGADLVPDAGRLAARAGLWLTDSDQRLRAVAAAQKTVEALGGALDRTLAALDPYLVQLHLENRGNA